MSEQSHGDLAAAAIRKAARELGIAPDKQLGAAEIGAVMKRAQPAILADLDARIERVQAQRRPKDTDAAVLKALGEITKRIEQLEATRGTGGSRNGHAPWQKGIL